MTTRKEKRTDWVVAGGAVGEIAHCRRCGAGLTLPTPAGVGIFLNALKTFEKQHAKCKDIGYQEPEVRTIDEWLKSRMTGTSSLTIYTAITGIPSPHGTHDAPHDPADFIRCYRLLKLFPSWRVRLADTVRVCKAWAPFVEHWDELEKLYEEEQAGNEAPRLYARIRELRGEKPFPTTGEQP